MQSQREATEGNIVRCKRLLCWINKTTNTHSGYATHFSTATVVTRALPNITFLRTLSVLFNIWFYLLQCRIIPSLLHLLGHGGSKIKCVQTLINVMNSKRHHLHFNTKKNIPYYEYVLLDHDYDHFLQNCFQSAPWEQRFPNITLKAYCSTEYTSGHIIL